MEKLVKRQSIMCHVVRPLLTGDGHKRMFIEISPMSLKITAKSRFAESSGYKSTNFFSNQ